MPAPRLAILDVGHGNSAVLFDMDGVVIDAGQGSALLEYLTENEVETIDVVLLSHADADHVGGLVQLLASGKFSIGKVRLNTDSDKQSKMWDDLVYELDQLDDAVEFRPSLTSDDSGEFDQGEIHIEIAGPSNYLTSKGAGSVDRNGRKLTSNSLSAVVRLLKDGKPVALLPGDLDDIGFDDLLNHDVDLRARICVFPHHGGRPSSGDPAQFVEALCNAVSPSLIIFSIARGMHQTPRPEIIAAVREALPKTRIACTQLSEHCAETVPGLDPGHLTKAFSRGRHTRRCCSGTILVSMGERIRILPQTKQHGAFIESAAPDALCMIDKSGT